MHIAFISCLLASPLLIHESYTHGSHSDKSSCFLSFSTALIEKVLRDRGVMRFAEEGGMSQMWLDETRGKVVENQGRWLLASSTISKHSMDTTTGKPIG